LKAHTLQENMGNRRWVSTADRQVPS